MKRFTVLLTVCLSLYAFASQAQEICNNGIDDDGDGFLDCFDKDCANNFACGGTYVGNDLLCEARPSQFPKFSLALESASPDGSAVHLGRAVVGDIDGDGTPEIMTTNRWSKKIFILNGKATAGVNTIKKQLAVGYNPAYEDIAIANLRNGNGSCGEIFVLSTSWMLYAYDCNLNQLWSTQLPGDPGTIGIADFNGDGKEEIYARNAIYNAQTGAVIVAPGGSWSTFNGGPVAVDVLNDATKAAHTSSDPIKDDNLELVCGGIVYSVNISAGTITQEKAIANYRQRVAIDATSVADVNLDGSLDVVASGKDNSTGNTTIFFWDLVTGKVKTFSDPDPATYTINACPPQTGQYYKNGWHQGTGRVNIADLDGDGKPNLAFVSGKYLYALKDDPANATSLVTLWPKITVNEETSGNTGCTLFDFNGDGKSEIVYRDEKFIYIIDGTTGGKLTQQACVSRTNREYPIVADVDADGQSELCVTCRTIDFVANTVPDPDPNKADNTNFCDITKAEFSQVRVFRTGGEPWVPSRRVWNQHGYFNVNINDDLTIPTIQQKHHLVFSDNVCTVGKNRPLNGFLNQSPYLNSLGCPKYASPDLAFVPNSLKINSPTCPNQNFTISFDLKNQGDVGLSGDLPVTFYSGDPTVAGAVKLNTVTLKLSDLKVSTVFNVTNATVVGTGGSFELYVVLNDGGTTVPTPIKLPNTNFIECDYNNNIIHAPIKPLPVDIVAVKIRDNIKCGSSPTPNNGAVRAFIPSGTSENTTDYTFYWSIGITAKAIPADSIGATLTHIPEGNYTVYAVHKTAQCNSDTATVNVGKISRTINVSILQLKPYNNCKKPLGELKAVVNDTDGDGIGEPDTNFDFKWYVGNDIFGSQIGVNDTISGLSPITYTVLVTDKATGCQDIESFTIPDQTSKPVPSFTSQPITCSNLTAGSASANVGGDISKYIFKWYNGSSVKPTADFTGDTYSGLSKGKYTFVAISKASDCESDPVIVDITQTSPPVVNTVTTADQISCDATAMTGEVTANVVSPDPTSTYDFQWFKGQNTLLANRVSTTSIASNLAPSIYTVQVKDLKTGCITTAEATVKDMVVPVALLNIDLSANTSCIPNTGKIEVTSVSLGTTGDYTFEWYNGSSEKTVSDYPAVTGNILNSIPAGTYTVKAIHKIRKCETPSKTVTIIDNITPINVTLSDVLPPTDCSLPTGYLEVTITTANTNGYGFAWYNGGAAVGTPIPADAADVTTSTKSKKVNLSQGNYTVQVTNKDNGCTVDAQYTLEVLNSHKLDSISQHDITNCVPGKGGDITAEIKNLAPSLTQADYDVFVFSRSTDPKTSGTIVPPNGTTNQVTTNSPLDQGYYTLVAVAKTGATAGCRAARTFFVKQVTSDPIINGDPTATIISNNTFCKTQITNIGSGSIGLSVGGNPADYDYAWSNGATTQNINGLIPGDYTVRVTYHTLINQGCFTERTFTVLNNEQQLSVDMANGDLSSQQVTHCNPMDGKTPVSEGSAFFQRIIENNVAATPNFASYIFDWRKIDGSPAPLDGNGQSWDVINVLTPGQYYVTAINTVSNCDVTANFTIDDQTINTVDVSLTSFTIPTQCLKPVNVTGSLETSASGTGASYSYNWFEGNNTSGNPLGTTVGTTSGPNNENADNLIKGFYTVRVTNNSNQCSVIKTFELPVDIRPVTISASATPLTVCYVTPKDGGVFALVTSGNPNDYNYNWYFGNTVKVTPDSVQKGMTNLAPGNYIIKAIDQLDAACSVSDTVTVRDQRMFPVVSAEVLSPLTICDPSKPDGVASANVKGNFIDYDFFWYNSVPPSGNAFYTGAQLGGLAAQTYSVIGKSIFTGCSDTTQVTINIKQVPLPMPEIEILSQVISCITNNGALTASVDGNTSNYIFDWYIGSVEKTSADFTGELYDSLAVGIYSVTATSRITGCKSPLASEEIIAKPVYPDFDFKIQPTTCTVAVDNVSPTPSGGLSIFMLNDEQIDKIEWNVNGTIIEGPIITNIDAGTYSVTVTSQLGCSTTKEVTLKTDIRPFNGISRNRDGANDIFMIGCIENFPTNIVRIYNRAGTLVYEAENYDNINIYFDGRSNKGISVMGNNLPDGTYFYIVDKRDGSKPLAGYLEIVN
jgi:uncharacterized protein (DUF2141 family)